MPTLKRRIANVVERLSGNLVIPPNQVHLGPERYHLKRFFKHFEIDCVFDVGANEGQYATQLREAIGYTGPIISFEPIPDLVNLLKQKSAGDPNWHIEGFALDREAGPATFNVMKHTEFSSLHRPADDQPDIFKGDNVVVREVPVERATLAQKFPEWQAKLGFKRAFLKMDTQGNDMAVVEGASDYFQKFVGLQSELAIKKLYAGAKDMSEVIADYSSRGFELSALVPNNAGHFPVLVEIDCIMYRKDAVAA